MNKEYGITQVHYHPKDEHLQSVTLYRLKDDEPTGNPKLWTREKVAAMIEDEKAVFFTSEGISFVEAWRPLPNLQRA